MALPSAYEKYNNSKVLTASPNGTIASFSVRIIPTIARVHCRNKHKLTGVAYSAAYSGNRNASVL